MRGSVALAAASAMAAMVGRGEGLMRPTIQLQLIPTIFSGEHRKGRRRAWTHHASKYKPHQGARECARRLRNIERHGSPG